MKSNFFKINQKKARKKEENKNRQIENKCMMAVSAKVCLDVNDSDTPK